MYTTDAYFAIGHRHYVTGSPCQDYALSGMDTEGAFAVVSDGCSSGGATDVGARMVALSTAEAIRDTFRGVYRLPDDALLRKAKHVLGLSEHDLLATSLSAFVQGGRGQISVQGDGVVAFRFNNGVTEIRRFEWMDNRPYYPVYALNEATYQMFVAAHGGTFTAERFTEEVIRLSPAGEVEEREIRSHSLFFGMWSPRFTIDAALLERDEGLRFIALFSDGVSQIESLSVEDAVLQCLAYKQLAGQFVKRRMIAAIRDMRKLGKGPIDDIACAVIRLEDEKSPVQTEGQ